MAQVTDGIRKILALPSVYSFFQTIMGAKKTRQWLVNDVIKPIHNMNVLDIGCGPADILELMPDVNYWGYDISEPYISHAKLKYGSRGNFTCKIFTEAEAIKLPKFDVVIMIGVLHHLDDIEAINLLSLLHQTIKPGGRLVTLDASYSEGQNPISKYLISKDRGKNVRDEAGYSKLIQREFSSRVSHTLHQAWIPYTYCLIECAK